MNGYRLKKGDQVRVRRLGDSEWSRGAVMLASGSDPSSVFIALEDGVRSGTGFLLNGLPVTIHYEKEMVVGLFDGDEYEIEVASMQATYSEPEEHK